MHYSLTKNGLLFGLVIVGAFLIAVGAIQTATAQQRPAAAQEKPAAAQEKSAAAQAAAAEKKAAAEARVAEIKNKADERKLEVKAQVCEQRQAKIGESIPKLSNSATVLQRNIDTMYERVQGFYESGQLTVANYSELDAKVAGAQEQARVTVEAISKGSFSVDCANPNLGAQLDGYRTLVRQARDDLKGYRAELVGLISALRAEAAAEDAAEATEDATVEEETVDEE